MWAQFRVYAAKLCPRKMEIPMLPSSSGPGRQPPQAGNGGSSPSGSAKEKQCPVCSGDMHGYTYTCFSCWGKLSNKERTDYIMGEPPMPKPLPATKLNNADYELVAGVLSTVREQHHTFGVEKQMFDRLVNLFCINFRKDNRRFDEHEFIAQVYAEPRQELKVSEITPSNVESFSQPDQLEYAPVRGTWGQTDARPTADRLRQNFSFYGERLTPQTLMDEAYRQFRIAHRFR